MASAVTTLLLSRRIFNAHTIKKVCHPLVATRNAHFTYVPDTPPQEYGMTF